MKPYATWRFIRWLAFVVAPSSAQKFLSYRSRRRYEAMVTHLPAAERAVGDKLGWRVTGGPFDGLTYINRSTCSTLVPKLCGFYERELHPWLERLMASEFDIIIDVGCAEGYYAVGLARAAPKAHIVAFDISSEARRLCSELAAINELERRVEVRGECDHSELESLLRAHKRSLIVCDCEGFEAELLDPSRSPALYKAYALVELHDVFKRGVTKLLMSRFCSTHKIEIVHAVPARAADFPDLAFLGPVAHSMAVSEFRPAGMSWMLLTPFEAV